MGNEIRCNRILELISQVHEKHPNVDFSSIVCAAAFQAGYSGISASVTDQDFVQGLKKLINIENFEWKSSPSGYYEGKLVLMNEAKFRKFGSILNVENFNVGTKVLKDGVKGTITKIIFSICYWIRWEDGSENHSYLHELKLFRD